MNKKKAVLPLVLSLLALVSCGNETSSTSSASSSSSSTSSLSNTSSSAPSSSTVPEEPKPAKVFSTITEMLDYLRSDGKKALAANGVSSSYAADLLEPSVYSYVETSEKRENTSFADSTLAYEGTIKETRTYDYKEPVTTDESYQGLRTVRGDIYYDVVDFADGQDKDTASKEKASGVDVASQTGLDSIDTFLSLYDEYLKDQVIVGFDDIDPTVGADGSTTYEVEKTRTENADGYTYSHIVSCALTFDKDTRLTSYSFDYQQLTDSPIFSKETESGLFVYEQKDVEESIVYGTKAESGNLSLNPEDYFMTAFAVQLQYSDGLMPDRHDADKDHFPYDMLVHARAIDVQPAKALDTDLEIVSSSDPSVISVTDYGDGESYVKAVGVGKTTLTVEAENGMTKTVDVTVEAPALESIELKCYSSYFYKGEEEDLYIYTTPDNSQEEYEVVTTTPDIVEVRQDDRGYYSVYFKEVGDGVVIARSKTRPEEVNDTLTFHVQEKKSVEETKASLIGTWKGDVPAYDSGVVEDAATVVFNEDKTGSLTITSDDTGYTFPVNEPLSFTWDFMDSQTYEDRVGITFSTISFVSDGGFQYEYADNDGYIYRTGENAYFDFRDKDPNNFYLTLSISDATKVA